MLYKEPVFIPAGDAALIIKAGEGIHENIHLQIRKLLNAADEALPNGVTDLVPSYNELLVCFDPLLLSPEEARIQFSRIWDSALTIELPPARCISVPVLYGGSAGPDLEELAAAKGLPVDEFIRLHSSVDYLVYMLGFTPGFCYLGGLDERLAAPRKETPRVRIPAGSVGIAGAQTGIYPLDSPGGWQLIGLTPLRLFDTGRDPVFLAGMGDYIRFYPVEREHFEVILSEISRGVYLPEIKERESR